jgi:hypothetical protein
MELVRASLDPSKECPRPFPFPTLTREYYQMVQALLEKDTTYSHGEPDYQEHETAFSD